MSTIYGSGKITASGAFFATTLGVPTLEYAPWALLCWINPILSIIFAYLGIAIFNANKNKQHTPVGQV